jgi:hypothetical protein
MSVATAPTNDGVHDLVVLRYWHTFCNTDHRAEKNNYGTDLDWRRMPPAQRSKIMPTSNHKNKPDEPSLVGEAVEKTKRLGAFMEEKAEQATKAVGAGMESLGAAIHEHEPTVGVLHNAGEAVAAKLEGGGQYLEAHGLQGVGEDVTNLIRKNPIPALLVGVGVGFLLARMLKGS